MPLSEPVNDFETWVFDVFVEGISIEDLGRWQLLGRVDVDGGRRPSCDGGTANETLRVGSVGGVERGRADLQDGVDAVVVDVGGGEEGDAGRR